MPSPAPSATRVPGGPDRSYTALYRSVSTSIINNVGNDNCLPQDKNRIAHDYFGRPWE